MKKLKVSLLCLLVAMVAISCSKTKVVDSTPAPEPIAKEVVVVQDKAEASDTAIALGAEATTALNPEAQNNDFSFRFWAAIDQEGENTFFSPYSVNTALAMVYNGSKGNTAKEIAAVMGYNFLPDQTHSGLIKMQQNLNKPTDPDQSQVKVANALFTARQTQDLLVTAYLKLLEEQYLARLFSLDFNKAEETAAFINQWIEDNTNNRIKNMVDADQVRGTNNGLFLANAVYFKARWQNQFKEHLTKKDVFFTTSAKVENESKTVDMMQTEAYFPYAQVPGAQLLEMPYEDADYSMLVVLPDEIDGITKELNATVLQGWLKALSEPMKVEVLLPRFKVELSLDKLTKTFKSLGMQDAFNADKADFSGIMNVSDSGNLYISKIAHKAFLQVMENGTEAAAATVITMMKTSLAPPEPTMAVFRADKPFLCLILHKPDNTILFAGKVVKPEAAEL